MTAEEKLLLIEEILNLSPEQFLSGVIRKVIDLPEDINELPIHIKVRLAALRKVMKEMKSDEAQVNV